MTKKEKMEVQALAGGCRGESKEFQSKGAFWHLGKRLLSRLFPRLQAEKTRPGRTRPAAAHRVHGLDHARSRGHAAGVLLQAVRLLVDGFHLDVRLPQRDPTPTWKQNTIRLRAAAGLQCWSRTTGGRVAT